MTRFILMQCMIAMCILHPSHSLPFPSSLFLLFPLYLPFYISPSIAKSLSFSLISLCLLPTSPLPHTPSLPPTHFTADITTRSERTAIACAAVLTPERHGSVRSYPACRRLSALGRHFGESLSWRTSTSTCRHF